MREIIIDNTDEKSIITLVENSIVTEKYEEDFNKKRIEGNIYLGKIQRVLPGLQAVFVDIGNNRNAFLHIKDIVPKVSNETGNKNESFEDIDIKEYVKVGMPVIVQVKKDQIMQKGPRVSTHINMPGRFVVIMPGTKFITVSQKVENKEEINRLKEIVKKNLNKDLGIIIRTSAIGKNEKEIKETLSLDTINRYSKVRYYQGIKDVKYSKDYLNYNDAVWEQTLKNNIYPVISLGEKEYQSYLNKLHLSYFDSKDKVILINNIIQTVYKNNKNINVNYNALDYKENDLVTAANNKTYEIVKVTNIRPLGFESRYNSPYFIVSDEVMDTLKSDSNVSIFIKSSNANKTQDDIEKIFNYKYYSLDNLDHDAELVNRLYTLIAIFLYGFIIVIALIGVTNIFNTLTTSIELRKREFAILKSIGMTSKEFNKMIFLESFFFCFKSLIIGIPIGICLSYLIYLSFNQEIMFSFDVPYKGIIISVILVFVLIFTLMKYSVTKANNSNIIDTIRNENI